MLKSEMQHHFWVTKKTVQRKLGTKEDEHIISSDAYLDAKIEIFKSIADTSTDLNKIIDLYQERLCILSQEESVFGRFLKEVGKRSKTTGFSITNTGKAVSYSGQQRMSVRVPLLRLQHEVDVFRNQAVRDTQNTIQTMEKERTEYRAALSWMKSASIELDPDTGRGLDKFRNAQSHVRISKQNFDSLSMDCIQKIDLLAAARCNMYSHALASYMKELKQFAKKTACTFQTISFALANNPKYDFCVLKDLTQEEGEQIENASTELSGGQLVPIDKDQLLFFAEEYVDEKCHIPETLAHSGSENMESELIELKHVAGDEIIDTKQIEALQVSESEPSKFWYKILNDRNMFHTCENATMKSSTLKKPNDTSTQARTSNENPNAMASKTNAWIDLFAELDPLSNQEAFDLKLSGGLNNYQQT